MQTRPIVADLTGTTGIVTGGARGIGAATVELLAKAGCRVWVLDIDGVEASSVAQRVGGIAHQVDARDAVALERFFQGLDADGVAIDILVNNVGGGKPCILSEMTTADWDDALELNLRSAFIPTRGVFPLMRRRGSGAIVNVSSIAAHGISPRGGAGYAASKAALLSLTRQTAYEWARFGIRANAVCPGPTRTDLTISSSRAADDFPLGRWIMPGDVAEAVVFLASPQSGMCSGTFLDVDGAVKL